MDPKHANLKVLTFFAHPDDETMFLGGTLAFLTERGVEVYFVCATRGEGGERGDPPICLQEELGFVREEELRCAVNVLGGSSLKFFDYQDPQVGPDGELYPFTNDLDGLIDRLIKEIIKTKPQVILTHGIEGEYGHPGHVQAHQAMIKALERIPGESPTVYSPGYVSRDTGRFTPEPEILLDISSWKDQKISAACCHRSQHDLFIRHGSIRAGKKVTVPEMIREKEALCLVDPGIDLINDQFKNILSEITLPLVLPEE